MSKDHFLNEGRFVQSDAASLPALVLGEARAMSAVGVAEILTREHVVPYGVFALWLPTTRRSSADTVPSAAAVEGSSP